MGVQSWGGLHRLVAKGRMPGPGPGGEQGCCTRGCVALTPQPTTPPRTGSCQTAAFTAELPWWELSRASRTLLHIQSSASPNGCPGWDGRAQWDGL